MAPGAYVFFDVDDTLVEWTVDMGAVFAQVAGEAGVTVTPREAMEALERGFDTVYDGLVREHAEGGDEHALWLEYDGHVLALLGVGSGDGEYARRVTELLARPRAIRLFPEVREALECLRASGARLGIVTSRPLAGPDLEALGIRDYFDPILDAFHAGGSKRAGRTFHLAARHAAQVGRTAWHVGDSYRDDVEGARAAGLNPILVDRKGRHCEEGLARVSDLREVARIVADAGAGRGA